MSRVRAATAQRRPRSMRRMTVIGALVVFLAVLITPTLHSYLQRRSHIGQLREQVVSQRKDIAAQQAQLKKWQDPAYIKQQAGRRLGFAEPGKALTVYVDKQGQVHDTSTTGNGVSTKLPWYGRLWQSAVNADHQSARR